MLVTAVAAGPAFGTLTAARATRDRRVPANRSARRWLRDTARLRRAALEAGVLVAAAGALVALHQRGIGGGVLAAGAPALCALAGALLLARALPLALRFALRRLLRLAWVSAVALPALGLLGLALGAAAGAPERWQTLTRLRTLGLRPREARWVAAGELLPPVLLAAVGGPLLGAVLAHLTFGSLSPHLLTGTGPAPAAPWWGLGLVAVVFLAAVAVVVPVESALRRRRRLSEVLRAGDT